jgi:FKBP-type peptidyl-prolyl cis-trans isomerase
MRQGGKRVVVVPPDLGFGSEEVRLQDGTVPAGATVRYDLELTRVSVPPS